VHELHDHVIDREEDLQLVNHARRVRIMPPVVIPSSSLFIIAAGIVTAVAILIFISAVLIARQGQKAAYYSVRRETQRAANRRLSLALGTLLAAGGMAAAGMFLPRETAQPPPPSTLVAAASPDSTPTKQQTQTSTPLPSPSPSPIESPLLPTSAVKATVIPEPTSSLISPLVSPVREATSTAAPAIVAPNRRLVLNTIASDVDANGAPIGVGTTFTRGVPSVYIFFDYQDAPPSALLRHTWFRNGGSVYFRSERLQESGSGTGHVVYAPQGGLRAGLYEVRLQLGGVLQFVANFEVK
jgi:hypothetical protein